MATGAAVIWIDSIRVLVSELLSVTRTVILAVPAVVGVPLICPAVVRLNPEGRVPAANVQVYGPVPPTEVNVAE